MTGSALDEIPGVGKVRAARLVKEFGSVQKVQQAALEELEGLSWLPTRTAKAIYEQFSSPLNAIGGTHGR